MRIINFKRGRTNKAATLGKRFTRAILINLMLAVVMLGGGPWRSRAATSRFVAVGGSDTGNDCSNSGSPCATIQNAINQSARDDTINVGAGTYTENVTVSQEVTIQGSLSDRTIVNGNNAGSVFFIESVVTLNALTITNGKAQLGGGVGGGINNSAILTVTGCTISDNTATDGGGIFNTKTLTVINSTISDNKAISTGFGSGTGGGVFNAEGAHATFVNTTINGNSAQQGGGIFNDFILKNMTNTIIAGSTSGGDCFNHRIIVTTSRNLIQDGSCSPAVSGDPKLGPLQDNGGPTFTHALLAGSPAIDAGDDAVLGSPLFLTTDQRGPGFPRKVGMHVDIGAFEVSPSDTIKQLIATVDGFNLQPRGIGVSLDAKLNAALSALATGDTATACADLSDFINEVKAQSG